MRALKHIILGVLMVSLASQAQALRIQDLKTKSGLTAWFVEDHSVPVVSLVMSFQAGSTQAPKDKIALPDFLASILTEGAGDLDAKSFAERLQDKGISISVSSTPDRLFVAMRAPRRHWQEGLSLLKLMLTKPRFDPDAFERVRQSMIQGFENAKLTPGWKASEALTELLYKDHPYGATVKSAADINAINVKDLDHFLRQCVATDSMIVGGCGDVSPQDLVSAVEEITKSLPVKGDYKAVAEASFPDQGETRSLATPHPQSVVLFAHPGLHVTHPDALKLYVLTYVLGGGSFHSWMMEEIRTRKGLAYDAGCGTSSYAHAALVKGSVQSDGKTVFAAMDLIKSLVKKLKNEGISQEELDATKSFLEGSLPLELSSSLKIATALHELQVDKRPIDYLDKRAARIQALTLKDVNAFAKSFFDPDRMITVVAGSQGPLPTPKSGDKS
ncbi:MAG: hypothetical protein C0514_00580 [Candidatus Puniceispirillum sp.]|nr:hypothetical protein [Candidatus Puniceispirillum sp.]